MFKPSECKWPQPKIRLAPVVEDRKCLPLNHYLLHPTFGLCHVCVQTWFPFTVAVWLNGRLWLARQMDPAGLAYVRRGHGIVAQFPCSGG